jgi:hypothetical protein
MKIVLVTTEFMRFTTCGAVSKGGNEAEGGQKTGASLSGNYRSTTAYLLTMVSSLSLISCLLVAASVGRLMRVFRAPAARARVAAFTSAGWCTMEPMLPAKRT